MASPSLTEPKGIFTFDAVSHQYFVDGREIPGVSHVLEAGGLKHLWHGFHEAQYRGLCVHSACEYYDLNDLDWHSIDPAYRGYVDAYVRFRDEKQFVPELIEYQTWHPQYRYGGTLDRRGTMDGKSVLLDLKTGQPEDWWKFQLAGYQLLGGARFADDERYALQLNKDGSYKLHPLTGLTDVNLFLAALTITHYKWSLR